MYGKTKNRIKIHEGKRNVAYLDSVGVLTVGYGHSLGIKVDGKIEKIPHRRFTDKEIDLMFDIDFNEALRGARSLLVFEFLNEARQGVLIEMVFQLGLGGVKKFRLFLDAARRGDWGGAKREMLDSRWADQTPKRAQKLAEIFYDGS